MVGCVRCDPQVGSDKDGDVLSLAAEVRGGGRYDIVAALTRAGFMEDKA